MSCGIFLRNMAIIIFVGLCVCTFVNYSISANDLEDSIIEYQEEYLEHGAENSGSHESSECYMCKNYEDEMEEFDDRETSLNVSLVTSLLMYLLYSSILFAVGEIAGKKTSVKVSASTPPCTVVPASSAPVEKPAPAAPVEAPVLGCPQCGSPLPSNSRFCVKCGTSIQS